MADRPNILIITADDLGADRPGCFGGHSEAMPHLDHLASEGVRFANAHVNVAVCAPSRSILMAGRYAHRCGATGFEGIDRHCPLLPEVLAEAGYFTGIIDKVPHTARKPGVDYWQWERGKSPETGHGRAPSRFGALAAEFFNEAAERAQPFLLVANSRDPHRPFSGGRQEQGYLANQFRNVVDLIEEPSRTFTPGEVYVPGFLPDIPEIRQEMADYMGSVRRLDDTIGSILTALDEAGRRDNTITVFLSDHGMPFPFAKFNCYPFSTQTPLVVRWPGHTRAGSAVDSFVEGVDLMPTLLEAVGVDAPEGLDGRSFAAALRGDASSGRSGRIATFHQTQQKESFEMRSWVDADHAYIYNAWSGNGNPFQDETGKGYAIDAMIREGQEDAEVARRLTRFLFRSPDELYDLRNDPDCLHNVVDDPAYREARETGRKRIREWMVSYEDPLLRQFDDFLAHGVPYVDPQNSREGLQKRCRIRY